VSHQEASSYPEVFSIVTNLVKPTRGEITKQIHESDYWKFWDKRLDSYRRLAEIGRCLALSAVTSSEAVAWVQVGPVFQNKLVLFLLKEDGAFAVLQSRIHWMWVHATTASRGPAGVNYSPTHCFETFPFPESWQEHPDLEIAGKVYYEFRADLMVRNDEGLTKTHNRFHDPEEHSPDIVRLRELHADMDRAVLDAYGWSDIPTDCEFLLDYEIDEEEWGRRRKPYRFRWPDDVRDEVLARLLELNAKRAEEEAQAGVGTAKKRRRTEPAEGSLF
jgi:hypothetical protein